MIINIPLDTYLNIEDDGNLSISVYVEDAETSGGVFDLSKLWKEDVEMHIVCGSDPAIYKPTEGHPEMLAAFATKLEDTAKEIRTFLKDHSE
jgi:hypothetical protein